MVMVLIHNFIIRIVEKIKDRNYRKTRIIKKNRKSEFWGNWKIKIIGKLKPLKLAKNQKYCRNCRNF